jgi:hypothetical protein
MRLCTRQKQFTKLNLEEVASAGRRETKLRRMLWTWSGWQRYRNYPDPRVRVRFAREMRKLGTAYNASSG